MSAPKIEKAAELFGISITAFFREFDPETQDLEITIQTLKQEYKLFRMFHDLKTGDQTDFLDMTEKTYEILKERGSDRHE